MTLTAPNRIDDLVALCQFELRLYHPDWPPVLETLIQQHSSHVEHWTHEDTEHLLDFVGEHVASTEFKDAAEWYEWRNVLLDRRPYCIYCSKSLTKDTATLDHVVPTAKGGGNTRGNTVLACKQCNGVKADRTVREWIEDLERAEELLTTNTKEK